MELNVNVEIKFIAENGETSEQAQNRLYDLLYDALCRNTKNEFWFNCVEELD